MLSGGLHAIVDHDPAFGHVARDVGYVARASFLLFLDNGILCHT